MTGTPGALSDGDYGYDEAHDALTDIESSAERTPPEEPTVVTTETPHDSGNDYSYDMSHDIPPP